MLVIEREKINYSVFLVWWYFEVLIGMGEILTNHNLTIIRYIGYIILWGITYYNNWFQLKKSFCIFSIIYLGIAFFNAILVPYTAYSLTESITSFCVFLVPLYLFSSSNFYMNDLIKYWNKWYICSTIILLLIISSPLKDYLTYGFFSILTVPNTVVTLFDSLKNKKKSAILCFGINYFILLIYGSRMPALGIIVTGVFLIFYPIRKHKIQKILLLTIGIVLGIILYLNIQEILTILNIILERRNIYSRTIDTLLQDWGQKSILQMAGSSGREEIWNIALQFVREKQGMPGGFGVIRYLTDGERYYSHNIIFDLWIIMGIFSIGIVCLLIFFKKKHEQQWSQTEKIMINLFGIYFLICSLTGAHFLSDKYALLFWIPVFFYKGKYYK